MPASQANAHDHDAPARPPEGGRRPAQELTSQSRQRTTVFVAGATGYIGASFIRRHGGNPSLNMVAVARRPESVPSGITTLSLDGLSSVDPASFPPGPRSLIHAIGSGRETRPGAVYHGSVTVTETLLAVCKRLSIDQVVYMSGYGVGRPTTAPYFVAKAAAEELITASGLRYAILRPSYIVGGSDELTPAIKRAAQAGVVMVPGDGSYRLQPVLMDDVMDLFVKLVTSERGHSGVYAILGEPVSLEQFTLDVARRANPNVAVAHRDLAALLREAVLSATPEYSLDELGILVSDQVGPPTRELFGVRFRRYAQVVAAISGS